MAPDDLPTAKTLAGSALYSFRVYWTYVEIHVSTAKM
jgi:hypothetical protein